MSTVINICGADRSGTTMLDVMLGNADNAFSCGEVSAWFRPWRTHAYVIDCPCEENPSPVWQFRKEDPESEFHYNLSKEMHLEFVIDSSKDLCWVIDNQKWAAKHNMKVFNLLMWKNPIDMCYSHWKRSKNLTTWRKGYVRYYSKFFDSKLPYFAINYNDLVNDPVGILEKICGKIGMEYFKGKENFWEKKTHHHLFGSLGIRRQVQSRNSLIQPKTAFQTEFVEQIPMLEKQIKQDQVLQEILEKFQHADISNGKVQINDDWAYSSRRIYPWWYYPKKIKRAIQRYFPEEFDPEAREATETIPLYNNAKK